ncbi:MAG: prolyl oligopeptidase family serine peptidase [bacterium]
MTGRYRAGDQLLFLATCGSPSESRATVDSIALSPAEWSSIEYALPVTADSFAVADRPHRTIVLERDANGRTIAVRTTGFGLESRHQRIEDSSPMLIEHLLFDKEVDDIISAIRRVNRDSIDRGLAVAERIFSRFPTRRALLQRAFTRLIQTAPRDTSLVRIERAMRETTRSIPVARNTPATPFPDSGWHVPFTSTELLAAPSAAEIRMADEQVLARSRKPTDVAVIARESVVVGPDSFAVLIVSHREASDDGKRFTHVGAVFVPIHPGRDCCGTIVDVKGTNPGYSPLTLDQGPPSLRMLGTAATSYVVVVPSIRGEVMRLFGREYRSEGNRVDGWDGGAEDALSMLEAATTLVPGIDLGRVCAYGRSRGGAVALLAAERDRRIRCVVAISAPTDWFDAMWRGGGLKAEALDAALRLHATPFQAGGQFVERIVSPVSRGEWTLADARRSMIVSSPLYRADLLPATLAMYGAEDTSVPSENASLLASAIARATRGRGDRSVIVSPMAGHDADPLEIVRLAPAFLAQHLGTPVGRRRAGADAR